MLSIITVSTIHEDSILCKRVLQGKIEGVSRNHLRSKIFVNINDESELLTIRNCTKDVPGVTIQNGHCDLKGITLGLDY